LCQGEGLLCERLDPAQVPPKYEQKFLAAANFFHAKFHRVARENPSRTERVTGQSHRFSD